jgi:plastocyanin
MRMSTQHLRSRRRAASALCAAALIALAGCGSNGTSGGGGGAPQPAAGSGPTTSAAVITIKDFAFTTPASVGPGARVTVKNMDPLAHTVTADSGKAFDSPAPSGNSGFTAPTTPGSYPFHCSIHPEMHGTLVVK